MNISGIVACLVKTLGVVDSWILSRGRSRFPIHHFQTRERPPPDMQTVTYTQNPDGSVIETGVVVVKGSYVPAEAHVVANYPETELPKPRNAA